LDEINNENSLAFGPFCDREFLAITDIIGCDQVNEDRLNSFEYKADYKYVILCWNPDAPRYNDVVKVIESVCPNAYLVLWDDVDNMNLIKCFKEPNIIFKRELHPNSNRGGYGAPIYCLPKTSPVFTHIKRRSYSVSFVMGRTDAIVRQNKTLREIVYEELLAIKKDDWCILFDPGMPYEKYIDTLQRSKISINMYGGGADCIRFWEIMSCGACMISPPQKIIYDNPISEDCYAPLVVGSLGNTIQGLLENDRWKKIAMKGHKEFIANHTIEKRASFIKAKIKETI